MSQMHRFARFLILAGVFGVGLAGGAWWNGGRGAGSFGASFGQRQHGEIAPTVMAGTMGSGRRFATQEEMLTAIMGALTEDEELRRDYLLQEALGGLGSAELEKLFQHAVKVEDRERRDTLLTAVMARWAKIDPAGATAAARPYIELGGKNSYGWRSLETAVVGAWARAMPEAAMAAASAAPDMPGAAVMVQNAGSKLGEDDPLRRFEAVMRLPESQLRNSQCEIALRALAEKDSAAAEARLGMVRDPWKRDALHAEILRKLAKRDPSAALARLAELGPNLTTGSLGTLLVSAVLHDMGEQNPTQALAGAERLPEELRSRALGAALVGWARKEPRAALEWAASQGLDVASLKSTGSFSANMVSWSSLVMASFGNDYAGTLDWLRTQPASVKRDQMLGDGIWSGNYEQRLAIYADLTPAGQVAQAGQMVESMARTNLPQAEAWVHELPAGEARASAVKSLVNTQAEREPERLETLAEGWAAGADRDAALGEIASQLASKDAPRAMALARQIADSAKREIALESAFKGWAYKQEPAARAWLATATDFSAEHKRVLLRQLDDR